MSVSFIVRGWRRLWALLAALTFIAVALLTGTAQASLVYEHDSEIWQMNDDGTGAHVLVTGSQVGANLLSNPSVDPSSGHLTFLGGTPAPDGLCQQWCYALYSMVNGIVHQLTPPPANCPAGVTQCLSEPNRNTTTADGQVVYRQIDPSDNTVYEVPLDGSRPPVPWGFDSSDNSPEGFWGSPQFNNAMAADPADPSMLAFDGSQTCLGTPAVYGLCGNPLVVGNFTASEQYIFGEDDIYEWALGFSPDGRDIAVVETDNYPGVWVYTNEDESYAPNAASWRAWYVLGDPETGYSPPFYQPSLGSVTVGADGQIYLDDGMDIYALPASCWDQPGQGYTIAQTEADGFTPTPTCGTLHQPGSQAVALTSYGTPQGAITPSASSVNVSSFSTSVTATSAATSTSTSCGPVGCQIGTTTRTTTSTTTSNSSTTTSTSCPASSRCGQLPPPAATISVSSAHQERAHLLVALRCRGSAGAKCSARVVLQVIVVERRPHRRAVRRTVDLLNAPVTWPAGHAVSELLPLGPAARRLLKSRRAMTTTLIIRPSHGATLRRTVRLRRW